MHLPNNLGKLVLFTMLFILLHCELTRCKEGDLCDDFTLTNCKEKSKHILSWTKKESAKECQHYCVDNKHCGLFAYTYKTQNCTLYAEEHDYRQACLTGGLPTKAKYYDCINSADNTCALFIEEDCEYNGYLVHSDTSNRITDFDSCENECEIYSFKDCRYWVYMVENSGCYLYDSGSRSCDSISGPREPAIDSCPEHTDENTTTSIPSTLTTATTTEEHTKTTTDVPDTTTSKRYECEDLLLDECPTNKEHIINETEQITIEACMKMCDSDEHPTCESFFYKTLQEQCILYDIPIHSYSEQCFVFGSGLESFTNCMTNDEEYPDPCKKIVQGDCEMLGTVTHGPFYPVTLEDECFALSDFWHGRFYVLSNSTATQSCNIYDSHSRTCSHFRGPKGVSDCPPRLA